MSEQLHDFPNRTSTPIPLDNPFRSKVRALNHCVGMEEWARRLYNKDVRPIGIRYWIYLTSIEANSDHERHFGGLRDALPDFETIKRTINELADYRYFSPPNWFHLPNKYKESDPEHPGVNRFQSSYVPNETVYPHFKEAIMRARAYR